MATPTLLQEPVLRPLAGLQTGFAGFQTSKASQSLANLVGHVLGRVFLSRAGQGWTSQAPARFCSSSAAAGRKKCPACPKPLRVVALALPFRY